MKVGVLQNSVKVDQSISVRPEPLRSLEGNPGEALRDLEWEKIFWVRS